MLRKVFIISVFLFGLFSVRQLGVFKTDPAACSLLSEVKVLKSDVNGKTYNQIAMALADNWLASYVSRPHKCMRFWLDDYEIEKTNVDGRTMELEKFELWYSVKTYFFSEGQWNNSGGMREVDGWTRGKRTLFEVRPEKDAYILSGVSITPKN